MEGLSELAARLRQQPWTDAFDSGALRRGESYAREGRSRIVEIRDEQLIASCYGSTEHNYTQRIRLGRRSEPVIGFCTCPVGYNCKHVVAALLQLLQAPQASLATPLVERRIDDLQPQPILTLGSLTFSYYETRSRRMQRTQQHRAGLSFAYAEQRTYGKAAHPATLKHNENGELLIISRQPTAEQALRERLHDLGFHTALRQSQVLPVEAGELFELPDHAAWLEFVQVHLPELRAEGWQVELRPGFVYDLTPVESWYADVEESNDQRWFDLELGILVDGQRISLLPVLLRLIRNEPELLEPQQLARHGDEETLLIQLDAVRREDGQPLQVMLPFARLKPLLNTLFELYLTAPSDKPALRLGRMDAARLNHLTPLQLQWQGGERLRNLGHQLERLEQSSLEPPAGLNADLRPYQLDGLRWMQNLREIGMGGVLADDMGLGKTLQSLAHILTEKLAGRLDRPALVVMPTSLIPNWLDEAERFTPQLRVLALHGPKRGGDFARLDQFDLLLTSYSLLPRDIAQWRKTPLHLLLLDEAQNIKNPNSKAAQAACQLDARQRLCLTGTPLENHLGELWSQFHFLMPGWLGDQRTFNRNYRTPIEKHGDLPRLEHLKARIQPFLLRRRKDQVASDLPPKTEMTHWVDLGQAQRDLYETVRLSMDHKVREEIARHGLARSQIAILEALLRLRQACCDPRLLPGARAGGHSAKLESLLEMLDELLSEGRRVLLFSQFTSMLELIEAELNRHGIPYVLLTGATVDRRTPVRNFQEGKVPLFLISLKAGGTGLNLTAADTVIHYDPWWNPAAESQASDRAYRIGQDKPVFVYRLIARGTVEEKIQQLQQHKAELSASLLDGAERRDWRLTQDDIDALLAPLPS